MNHRSKCVILTPVLGSIELSTDLSLGAAQEMGYPIRKVYGSIYIDKMRSAMATKALDEGYDEIMWIDSDVVFNPSSIEVLRYHSKPIVCGLYPIKSEDGKIAGNLLGDCKSIRFGHGGGLTEIKHAATGFLHTRREVYEAIERKFNLPRCDDDQYGDIVPYFYPMIAQYGEKYSYFGEDISFSERARQCGYQIYADTSIRLGHIGKYRYSWEDMAGSRPRSDQFYLELGD